jgi:5-methylcytosine-specific restriction endonuclease McrA
MSPAHKRAIRIFERDKYQCQYCNRCYGEEQPPLHVHHRVFVSQGGKDDDDNLATCCFLCHADHGSLKNRRLMCENDDKKINELRKRYLI